MYTWYMYFITYNRAYQVDQVSFITEELLFQKELVAFEQISITWQFSQEVIVHVLKGMKILTLDTPQADQIGLEYITQMRHGRFNRPIYVMSNLIGC